MLSNLYQQQQQQQIPLNYFTGSDLTYHEKTSYSDFYYKGMYYSPIKEILFLFEFY